jgi:hypothetical protein
MNQHKCDNCYSAADELGLTAEAFDLAEVPEAGGPIFCAECRIDFYQAFSRAEAALEGDR